VLCARVSLTAMRGAKRVAILCAFSVTGLLAQSPQKPAAQPDVFLVTIDTLRADHLHCYGYAPIQTPALDNLANDGVRFAQAFTPSPITNTSHVSILTGLLPSTHGVMDFAVPLATEHPLWAELLKKRGYRTAAFIGSIVLDSHKFAPGLDRGFDFYDDFPEVATSKSRWERLERRADDVARRAENWLTAHPRGPRFVWVHFYDPHDPYDPPSPFAQMYKNRLYDGEIAYADSVVANFVAYLKNQGWYDNSVVIVVGDHGEGLGEHHEDTHGAFLYDSTLHVPLIVKLPRQKHAGDVVEAQVRTTDILPTVVDLLRIVPPGRFDGASLMSFFGAPATETSGRIAFGETDYPLRFGWAPLRSIRDDGFKFIEAPKPELYNLRTDPLEVTNTYAPWDAGVQRFRTMLADSKRKIPVRAPATGSVSKNTIAELKALGYLGRADLTSSTNVPEPTLLPDPKDKIEQLNLLHSAMMAVEDGRSSDARAALQRVLELDPDSPTALRQLGDFELQAGEFAKAVDHLQRALTLHFDDSVTAFHLGQALVREGNLPGAREALEASLKFDPARFDVRLLLGQVFLDAKNTKAAEDQFEAALLLEPQSSGAQLWLSKAQMAGKNFTQAAQRLELLVKSQPRNVDALELLAQAYAGLGRKEEAEQVSSRAKTLRNNQTP
jgi:choline-sulfatase